MDQPLKIVVASEHTFERLGIRDALAPAVDVRIVAEAANAAELTLAITEQQPQLIITSNGIAALALFDPSGNKTNSSAPVIIITGCYYSYLVKLMKSGEVAGLVLSSATSEELLEAVYIVSEGGEYCCHVTQQKIEEEGRTNSKGADQVTFTKMEWEVLKLISLEYTDKEIAAKMKRSTRTIESHKRNIRSKTNTHNNVGFLNFIHSRNLNLSHLIFLFVYFFEDIAV